MTDNLRQDGSDKFMAAVKPDAQKTWTEQQGDKLAGKTDKVASHMQPEGNKSTTQKIVDTVTPGNDAHRHVGHTGRQGAFESTKASIIPDSMKSDSQIASDYTKGKADNIGSHAQPDSNKSLVITPGSTADSHHVNHHHDGITNNSAHASDNYRQSNTDKLSSAVKPDAFKSGAEIKKDHYKGEADNMAGTAVRHEDKSVGQKIADGLNPNTTA